MTTFAYDHPKVGAEILLKWARDAVACRHGATLNEHLDESTLADFLDRLAFDGPRLRTALHFGLAAVVVQDGGIQSEELWPFFDQSMRDEPEFPGYQDSALIEMMALGIILEPRTVSWLERGKPMAADASRILAERVVESGKWNAIRPLAEFLRKSSAADNLLGEMVRGCAFHGLAGESLEILGWLAPDRVNDPILSHFVSYRLHELSPEQVDRFRKLFPGRGLSEAGFAVARARLLIEAGRIDEARRILDQIPDQERWRYHEFASLRVVSEMESGHFEEAIAVCEQFGVSIETERDQVAGWIRQILARYELDRAVSMILRIPGESSRRELAVALIQLGEIDRADAVSTEARSDLERAAILRAMAKATRENTELRERANEWLTDLERTLQNVTARKSPRDVVRREKRELERQCQVERWHRGEREPLELWIDETLARRDTLLASDDCDDEYDAAVLAADVALAFAETRQFDRFLTLLETLSRRERLDETAEALFENWDLEKDCDEILRRCRDPDDYGQLELLQFMAAHLANVGEQPRAQTVARHMREHFKDERGFEIVADVLRNRGDYEGARKLGGAPGRWTRSANRADETFTAGADDEERRDWVTSVKDWDQNPGWLLRYGCFGRAREAVEGLIRMHFQYVLPRWLTKERDEPDPNYPQEFEGICRRAQEEAKYRLWRNKEGPAPRTPWEVNVAIWKIEAMSWFLDLFAGTRINAMERKIERDLKCKGERAHEQLAIAVPAAVEMPAGPERFATLCKLAEEVTRHDDLEAPEELVAGLRTEAERLNRRDADETEQWSRLAVAMLEAGDASGAAEAWTEVGKVRRVDEFRIRDLAERARREDWHRVAPLCRRSPLACAVLAAKLAKWFPKARIRLP